MKTNSPPILRHIASLWSLWDYPKAKELRPLERQIAEIKEAGFVGFAWLLTDEHARLAGKHGLIVVGGFSAAKSSEFRKLIHQNIDAGAVHINVQLADHDIPVESITTTLIPTTCT